MKHLTSILFLVFFAFSAFAENLVQNPGFESTTAKWRTYCDAAGTTPVDGINGGAAGFALTSSTTSPLDEKASGIITKDAANRQGCGISTDFTAKASKVYQISFNYKITSGTYTEDSLKVYLYDVTNASMIEVAPTYVKNSTFEETFSGSVQTGTGTSYRLIIHNASTNATAVTLKIDGFSFGQNPKSFGTTITDWTSYTPTGAWTTATSYTGRYRRVGDHIEVQTKVSTSGTPDTADLFIGIPSVCTIDTTKLAGTSVSDVLGVAEILDSGVRVYAGVVSYRNTSTLSVIHTESGNSGVVNQASPMAFGASDVVSAKFSVPCVGWSSTSQILSSDIAQRPIAFNKKKSGSQSISSLGVETTITNWTANTNPSDSHGSFNDTTGVFTALVPGYFNFKATAGISQGATATGEFRVSLWYNDTTTRLVIHDETANTNNKSTNVPIGIDGVWLNTGDTVRLKVYTSNQTITVDATTYFSGSFSSGPSQVVASESIAARYKTAAGQSIANASTPIVDFGTKEFDDLGSVTTGASWKFQPNFPGKYEVCTRVRYANGQTWTVTSSYAAAYLYKNGSSYSALEEKFFPSTSTPSNSGPALMGCDIVKLLSTDYIDIRTAHNESTSRTLLSADSHNWITIKKVGNY